MKVVLAASGTRGDVEPCATVGLELLRRGHEVRMAVPPNLVGFAESAGLAGVGYGPDSLEGVNAAADFLQRAFKLRNPVDLVRAGQDLFVAGWAEMSETLTSLAEGADLLITGQTYHGVVANIGEYYDIPVTGLHYFPISVNGRLSLLSLPLPTPVVRSTMRAAWWLYWGMTKHADDAQRRELGLPRAAAPAATRMAARRYLDIQAYDAVCFPGLAAEWNDDRRPFVGALTMELPTAADRETAAWIAAGSPPIYFGFGSMPVNSPADTLGMIGEVCARLGERALVCAGWADYSDVEHDEHVKVVSAANHAAIFPFCRAVVHHGGAGTTAAGLRAGVPTLILWVLADQPLWGAAIKRLKVGRAQRFSTVTRESLITHLRYLLAPQYAGRARELANRMTPPADAVAATADLVEVAARRQRVG